MISRIALLLLTVVVLSCCAISSQKEDSANDSLKAEKGYSFVLKTDSFESKYLKRMIAFSLYYPKDSMIKDSLRSIILLNGYGGNEMSYPKSILSMDSLVNALKICVINVNGMNSWYMNSPRLKDLQYESYLMEELLPYLSSKYKIYKSGNKRGIAGLSMGGFGAVYLGMKHPKYFSYVGSSSGGLDILPFPKNWGLNSILGEQKDSLNQWLRNSPYYMIDSAYTLYSVKLVIDCGSEDFFFTANNLFVEKLKAKGVKYEYIVSPGGHEWKYWNVHIPEHIVKFAEYVK